MTQDPRQLIGDFGLRMPRLPEGIAALVRASLDPVWDSALSLTCREILAHDCIGAHGAPGLPLTMEWLHEAERSTYRIIASRLQGVRSP